MLEQSASEGLQPVERTHTGAICEELQAVGRTPAGEVNGGLSLVGGPQLEEGKRVRSFQPEEDGAAETRCEGLAAAPIPHPPVRLGEGGRESRRNLKPRTKGELGGRCF